MAKPLQPPMAGAAGRHSRVCRRKPAANDCRPDLGLRRNSGSGARGRGTHLGIGIALERVAVIHRIAEDAAEDGLESLFQARNAKPSGRGMLCRQTASFLHLLGHMPEAWLPAGKNTMSPGPSRRCSPFSSVTKTSPEMMCRVSSTAVMPVKPSGRARPRHDRRRCRRRSCASRFERACGVPSMIQCGGIGAGISSTSAGAAKTIGLGHGMLTPIRRRPLNAALPKKV